MSQGQFSTSGRKVSDVELKGKVFYCNKERTDDEKLSVFFQWDNCGAVATAKGLDDAFDGGDSDCGDAGVFGETTAWTGQDKAPWSNYLEVIVNADSWTFTVQQKPASYAVPGKFHFSRVFLKIFWA